VYRNGSSHANRFLVLYAFPRGDEGGNARLGVTVGRKLGGSVERNAVKRALREAFWSLDPAAPSDHDFVVVGRPALGELVEREGTGGVKACLEQVMQEAGLTGGSFT
jgi:ribonuclease P protein component